MDASYHILIVCTGNSCRSPMAEAMLKKALGEEGIDGIAVSSAGTMAPVGNPPTNNALLVMVEQNIDIAQHRARLLTSQMADRSDLILVMENAHLRFIKSRVPAGVGKSHTLKSFGNRFEDRDVDDPVGMDLDVYRSCRDELDAEIQRILPLIKEAVETKRRKTAP